ncbi:hypothetical protein X772_28575 [Mesorhizobium sp. LSJC280B00]|nr:hypothetical protein X772_28575 [Mesorhizobium sp. LSJC280B00]
MDLSKAGGHVRRDHLFCLRHRCAGMFPAPRIWPKVIPTEDDPFHRKLFFCRYVLDETNKIAGQHSGVATELVDLVAGCFDHKHVGEACSIARCCPNDQWMR